MAAGPLRSRIRRILGLDDDPMLISGKSFTLILAGLVIAATLAVLYVPTIGQAEPSTTSATDENRTEARSASKGPTNAEKNQSATEAIGSTEPNQKAPAQTAPTKPQATADRSNRTFVNEDEERERYARFEKALADKVPLVIVLFNDPGGYYQILEKRYNELVRQNKSVHLYGISTISYAEQAKRYGLSGKTDCLIFDHGKEIARITDIDKAEKLAAFISLARHALASAADGKPLAKSFPALEDQKLADIAYKRLGLEFEPIGEADLKRVKALGYDGGLKVVAGQVGIQGASEQIQPGDILVGLHAWPTATMKDLAEVLNRNDLPELNPLKFYVVRSEQSGPPSAENPN
jgi:hypothetical protein